MLSDAERIRIYGSAERVAEVDAQIKATVAVMPPLTPRQRDALTALLAGPHRIPPRPAKPVETRTAPVGTSAAA